MVSLIAGVAYRCGDVFAGYDGQLGPGGHRQGRVWLARHIYLPNYLHIYLKQANRHVAHRAPCRTDLYVALASARAHLKGLVPRI